MWKLHICRFAICLAIANSAPAQDTPAEPVDIKGAVVNSLTGEPIAGASVVLAPGFDVPKISSAADVEKFRTKVQELVKQPRRTELSATTDEAGKFTFHTVAGVGWSLSVSHSNYRAPQSDNDIAHFQGPPTLKPEPVVVKLDPLGVVEGKVLNEDGEPLPGVTAELIKIEILDGRRNLRRYASKTTDDLGAYRLWYISPGSYYLRVAGTAPLAQSGVAYGPLYYPSSPDLEGAQLVRVGPGETVHAELNVAGRSAFHIRGRFADTISGRPVSLRLLRGDEEIPKRFTTNSSAGTFDMFDVTAGSYTLQASSFLATESLFGETQVTVRDGDLDGVVLNLVPGISVAGSVDVMVNQPLVMLTATHMNPRHLPPGLSPKSATTTDRDGRFMLPNLWPGHYVVKAQIRSGGNYVRSITSGSVDVMANGLTINSGAATVEPIRVQYGDDVGSTVIPKISETVPDADLIVVALLPKSGNPEDLTIIRMPAMAMPKMANLPAAMQTPDLSKAMATFTFPSLAPGDYTVYAWRNGQQLEYRNPAVLAALSAYGVAVTVAAGDSKEVMLKVIPKADSR